jgi:hypothetical protein
MVVVVVMMVVAIAVMMVMMMVPPSVMMMMVVMAIPVMMVMMVMLRDLHIRVGSHTWVGSGPSRRRVSRFDLPQQSESIRNRIEQLRIGSGSQNLGRVRARYGRGLRSIERCQPRNCANQADDLIVHTRLLGVDGGGACLPSRLPMSVKQHIVAFVPPPGHSDREFEYTIMNKRSP